jgi:hypothetical protein
MTCLGPLEANEECLLIGPLPTHGLLGDPLAYTRVLLAAGAGAAAPSRLDTGTMLARVDALMGGPHVPTPDADRDALMRVIIAANADTAKRQAEGAAAPAHRRSSRLPSVAAIEEAAAPLPLPALHAASPPGPAAEGEPRAAARLGGAAPRPDARTDLVHKREIRQWFFPLCKMAANVTKRAGFQRDAIATEEKVGDF